MTYVMTLPGDSALPPGTRRMEHVNTRIGTDVIGAGRRGSMETRQDGEVRT